MKRHYDIIFTVEMSEEQCRKLDDATGVAEDAGAYLPLWHVGVAAVEALEDECDVKAKLVKWVFRRNPVDLRRRGE